MDDIGEYKTVRRCPRCNGDSIVFAGGDSVYVCTTCCGEWTRTELLWSRVYEPPAPPDRRRLIITPEQYGEGYRVFVKGVVVKKRYPWAHLRPDGNYEVLWPPPGAGEVVEPDRIPVVDAR